MSGYANFDPYDPEAVRFVKWLIEVANVEVTDFDATIEREMEDISIGMWQEFRPSGHTEVTVHMTLRGSLPPGAEYTYSTDVPAEALPPGTKALP